MLDFFDRLVADIPPAEALEQIEQWLEQRDLTAMVPALFEKEMEIIAWREGLVAMLEHPDDYLNFCAYCNNVQAINEADFI